MSSSLNSTCKHCRKRFNSYHSPLVILKPCGHISHDKCLFTNECLVCNCAIIQKLHENDVVKGSQDDIDLKSMKRNLFRPNIVDYLRCMYRFPFALYYFLILFKEFKCGQTTYQTMVKFLTRMNKLLNVNVTVTGKDNLNYSVYKVFVCNHVSYHDCLILPRFLQAGILSSKGGMENILAPLLAAGLNTLVIDRGNSHNTVTQMNQFIATKKDSLFCFPQGIFGSYRTLTRFRTGSFATNYSVQPVVLKYAQDVSSMSFFHALCYPAVDVELIILPTVKREMSNIIGEDGIPLAERVDLYAERVRRIMASRAGFGLSNVDSHDVREAGEVVASVPLSGTIDRN